MILSLTKMRKLNNLPSILLKSNVIHWNLISIRKTYHFFQKGVPIFSKLNVPGASNKPVKMNKSAFPIYKNFTQDHIIISLAKSKSQWICHEIWYKWTGLPIYLIGKNLNWEIITVIRHLIRHFGCL